MNDDEEMDDIDQSDDNSASQSRPSSSMGQNSIGKSLKDKAGGKVKGNKDAARRAKKKVQEGIKKTIKAINAALDAATGGVTKWIRIGLVVVVIIILIAAAWVATEEEETEETSSSIERARSGNTISGESMSEAASEYYGNTGSLLIATEEDITLINEEYIGEIEDRNNAKTVAFSKEYFNGDPDSTVLDGAADVNETKTFYEHVLSAEKYNFNRINWRAFTRANLASGSEPTGEINMKLDEASGLQYPEYEGNLDGEAELEYYLNMLYPYLQSWVIPLAMVSGTTSGGDEGSSYADSYNTRFGYEIISKGYHKITYDRFETYTRTKKEAYREYDEFNVAGTVERTCKQYKIGVNEDGDYVAATDDTAVSILNSTACTDAAATFEAVDENTGVKYVEFPSVMSSEEYNIKKYYENRESSAETYTEKTNSSLINSDLGDTANYQYDITFYQAFDVKMNKEYGFSAYDLTLPENTANESAEPYTTEKVYENSSEYVAQNDSAPTWGSNSNATVVTTTTTVNLNKKIQDGETVTVERKWMDQLIVDNVESGNYTLEDVEEYCGETLNSIERQYYNQIIDDEDGGLNLVDLLNSKQDNYEKYLRYHTPYSEHVGYSRDYLSLSYHLLKQYLQEISENFSRSFMWGQTIIPFLSSSLTGEGITGETLIVSGVDVIYPFTSEEVRAGNLVLQDDPAGGGAYGYAGHTGIDISYNYSAAWKDRCNDEGMTDYAKCPYVRGPKVYTILEGTITSVEYSECNTYYMTGHCSDDARVQELRANANPNLKIRTSTWATSVTVESDDGTKTIYYHLYPDFEFFNSLAAHVGERIPIGTLVGYMGNTGKSSGLHLHIENGTTLWQANGSRTLALLREGLNNTTGRNIYQTTTTPGLGIGNTTPISAGNYTWYNLPEGLDPTSPPPESVVVETKSMKATIYGLFGDVGSSCTAGAGSYTDADGTHPYCKDQLGTSYSITPTFIEAAQAGMLPRVVANAFQQNGRVDEIPQGTLIYIKSNKVGVEDYGYAVVADRGGGVVVGSLDLYMPSVYDDRPYSKFNLGVNASQYWNLGSMGDITVYVTSYRVDSNKPIYMMKNQ